jgi:hypothetical protein
VPVCIIEKTIKPFIKNENKNDIAIACNSDAVLMPQR